MKKKKQFLGIFYGNNMFIEVPFNCTHDFAKEWENHIKREIRYGIEEKLTERSGHSLFKRFLIKMLIK